MRNFLFHVMLFEFVFLLVIVILNPTIEFIFAENYILKDKWGNFGDLKSVYNLTNLVNYPWSNTNTDKNNNAMYIVDSDFSNAVQRL